MASSRLVQVATEVARSAPASRGGSLMSSTETRAHLSSLAVVSTKRLWPALSAAVLGLVILYGVGIAPTEIVHNAAHDTRHSIAFPCH